MYRTQVLLGISHAQGKTLLLIHLLQELVCIYRQHDYNYSMYQIGQWLSPFQLNPTNLNCRVLP